MKKIGILGGMSPTSTMIYYQIICELTSQKFGGLHSPELIIRSLDFAMIESFQDSGNWRKAARLLNREAKLLEQAGAEILVLATNTMHKIADQIIEGINIRFIHIADATAGLIHAQGFKRPALIGTKYTMEQSFYLDRLINVGLDPIIPEIISRQLIHEIIYNELCLNIITDKSRKSLIDLTKDLIDAGADSIILGCTEVCMLLNDKNVSAKVFDTTSIHCEHAFETAIE